ncbi:MAG: TlpA family protein disulfide reductase, partial [Lachnospiraceae bacterium]|nr:TlpA family protein disulfide reductase [Lachnospiraceae bacterium]
PQDKEHISLAGSIGDKAGVTFTNIIPDEWLYNNILNSINVVPTTFLADSEGNIIPDTTILGAQVNAYKEAVNDYLEEIN